MGNFTFFNTVNYNFQNVINKINIELETSFLQMKHKSSCKITELINLEKYIR